MNNLQLLHLAQKKQMHVQKYIVIHSDYEFYCARKWIIYNFNKFIYNQFFKTNQYQRYIGKVLNAVIGQSNDSE